MANKQIVYGDLQGRRFVEGPTSSAPVTLSFYQGDTHYVILKGLIPATEEDGAPLGQIYIPAPITYGTMAAGLFAGSPDAPPLGGSFALRYKGQTTGELNWNIGKGELAAALNVLSTVVADGGLKVLENGPAHFYTIQWNDGDPGDEIEAVEVKLSPVCIARIRTNPAVDGQVLLKLIRAPLAYTDDFEYPTPPAVTVTQIRAGSTLRNEIQAVKIPADATGEFALSRDSVFSQVIPVAEVTAAEIARVLNELFADGVTRFTVTNPSRRTFYVEFVGPLAKADQPLMGVEMYSQTAVQTPIFKLPVVAEVPVDLELLARGEIPVIFEIAAWNGSEKTVIAQQSVTLVNNAIDTGLGEELEQAGAVQVVTNTVYIDNTEATPIVTVAAGAAYQPAAAGEEIVITHTLGTWHPDVRVSYQVSLDPERWVRIPDDQYEATATSANAVKIEGIPLNDDPEHEYYFERWKIYVASPDSTVQLLEHTHPVDQIFRIEGGVPKTLDVILDELASSLPTDWPNIPASKIVGQLTPGQIAIPALTVAMLGDGTFTSELIKVINGQDTVMVAIAERLATVEEFAETLQTVFASSEVLRTEVLKGMVTLPEFRSAVISALLLGPGVNTSFVPMVIPDFADKLPAEPGHLPSGALAPENLGNVTGYLPRADASNKGKYYTVVGHAHARPRRAKVFADGVKVFSTGEDWFEGTIEDSTECSLALLHFSNLVYTGANASVVIYGSFYKDEGVDALSFNLYKDVARTQSIGSFSGDDAGINGITFNYTGITGFSGVTAISGKVEGFIGMPNDQIVNFELTRTVSNFISAVEYEKELFTLSVNDSMLSESTKLTVAAAVSLQLIGNCEGYCVLELLRGHTTAEGSGDLNAIVWDETVFSRAITITDAAVKHGFVYSVTRNAEGAMTAEKTLYTKTTAAAAPGSANFILRARLRRFDTQNVAAPFGQLIRTMTGATAVIAKLT